MASEKQLVSVQIEGRAYELTSGGDPEPVHRAADMLQETIDRLKKRSRRVDSVDIVTLAALNVANTLVRERARGPAEAAALNARCEKLASRVQKALGDDGAPEP